MRSGGVGPCRAQGNHNEAATGLQAIPPEPAAQQITMTNVLRFHSILLLAALASSSLVAQISQGGLIAGNWPAADFPPGNPTSASGDISALQRESLGKMLFWDEQLSADRTMACGSCHAMEFGGNDKNGGVRSVGFDGILNTVDDTFGSPGVVLQDLNADYEADPQFGVDRQVTVFNAPTMINAAFFTRLFWDRRAGPDFKDESGQTIPGFTVNAALEDQAAGPPTNSVEMGHAGMQWIEIEQKLGALEPLTLATNIPSTFPITTGTTYQLHFDQAFGAGPITRQKVAMALAAYMRTLISDQNPFDLGTMTTRQTAGWNIFRTSGCIICHSNGGVIEVDPNGALLDPADNVFSDGARHDIQLDNHSFRAKTPTLRNVGLRKRLFHSGHVRTLREAMSQQYNNPAKQPRFRFDPLLAPAAAGAVIDFLENALTDPRVAQGLPPFDHPTLRGDITPFGSNLTGPGSAGSGGLVPKIIGNSPSKIGNTDWKVGLGNALPSTLAQLWFSPAMNPGQVVMGIPVEIQLSSATRMVGAVTGPTGTATFKQALPGTAALIGLPLNWQWFVFDPQATSGVAASPAASFQLF